MSVSEYLAGMDYQKKDNALYAALVVLVLAAVGIGWAGQYYVSVLVLGVVGLTIAVHLNRETSASHGAACPIGEHCYEVITSKYSRFLGVSVEVYGMGYYGFVLVGYLAAITFSVPAWFTYVLLVATALALLFSAYLTFIQAVPLGKWCIWCVTSALCCIGIFAFSVLGTAAVMPVTVLLGQFSAITAAVYFFGIALGMGTAITSDILLLNFLRDSELAETEASTISILSEITWAVLSIIVLAAAGYFYPNPGLLSQPSQMVALLALGVIIVNGAVLYLFFSPKLVYFRFTDEGTPGDPERLRPAAFVLTGVSTTSWIAMFFSSFAPIPASLNTMEAMFGGYAILVGLGAITAVVAEHLLKLAADERLDSYLALIR